MKSIVNMLWTPSAAYGNRTNYSFEYQKRNRKVVSFEDNGSIISFLWNVNEFSRVQTYNGIIALLILERFLPLPEFYLSVSV